MPVAKARKKAAKKKPAKRGRPSRYKATFDREAENYCALGATDEDLAAFFGVTAETVRQWRKAHPSFSEACEKGKERIDAQVERALWQRAVGYTHAEEKIFCNKDGNVTRVQTLKHYAPDTTACLGWLNNRLPDKWRQRREPDDPTGDFEREVKIVIISGKGRKGGKGEDE